MGPAVKTIRRGDRVVLPFNIACGFCFNCAPARSAAVLKDVIRVVNPAGHVGLIGVCFPEDPRGVMEDEKRGRSVMQLGDAWNKGVSIDPKVLLKPPLHGEA